MHKTIFLSTIAISLSFFSYSQSSRGLPVTEVEHLKKKLGDIDVPKAPPPIIDPESLAMHVFSYPNPSKGTFKLSVDNDLGDPSNAATRRPLPVYLKIMKRGSMKPVFTYQGRCPLGVTVNLTKFGQGEYYLIVSSGRSKSSQRLIVE